MYSLLDGNNFYCSCERIFRPDWRDRPMVTLSNNDGCCIARSDEAKALGVRMGQPWHEVRHLVQSDGLIAVSANFELYGDISDRMMTLASDLGPRQEVYSIDEVFTDLGGVRDVTARARRVRDAILIGLDMPVCVGIGPTKTLAKLANHISKTAARKPGSYPPGLAGVCNLAEQSPQGLDDLLARTDLGEVWGIGPRISAALRSLGLHTVLDVRRLDLAFVRRQWGVVMERTVRELQGTSCIELDDVAEPKQEIACTRSFGQPVLEHGDLVQAVSTFASRAAEKLRRQDSLAGQVLTFIRTSPFRVKDAQYSRSTVTPLRSPTQDTQAIARAALAGLGRIYRPGFRYAKAGVMLMDLTPDSQQQYELALDLGEQDKGRLMKAMDVLNSRYGRGTVVLGSAGLGKVAAATAAPTRAWQMRQEMLTPAYTTRWGDVVVVRG